MKESHHYLISGDVDGGWGEWSEWTSCNKIGSTCGKSSEFFKIRNCDTPLQRGAGAPCAGSNREEKSAGKSC